MSDTKDTDFEDHLGAEEGMANAAIPTFTFNPANGTYTSDDEIKAATELLTKAGLTVLRPQDLEWGVCTATDDGNPQPHHISLSLCSGCLEYDPD